LFTPFVTSWSVLLTHIDGNVVGPVAYK
jgi:hypothetical protein